ncbi:MAG: isochorismatase family cysteine hydrolase [Armatimonadota bacterium]|nr:isochorismatase family cysteine hydrolase [Armatimonadota bacterium]MDR7448979.1 isochorismatase family cysteine hydrolase [Armatimonadota bacterium]MDR7458645.1 isochorismatase family cysteine hydrolase [Armatimonadota bacterium]MDR7479554.1 isochorismatase family cysteine hydrolase [Armatimonadota bacterium]MDR7489324.1 isochorismatase family cysteine hydrolase [Armatimonadota bacterium]
MEAYFYGARKPVPPAFAEWLDPQVTAAVSIDMHRGHLDADDPECPCPAPRAREIVEPINAFHRACRRLGVPVIHVKTGLRPSGVDDVRGIPSAWRLTFPMTVGPIPGHERHGLQGTRWTELVTEVAPEDHIVDTKKRLSIFYPTDLDFLLRQLRRRTVVLTGGFTDCCVLNAAFDAANRDYRVVVPRDLVRGFSPEMEEAALHIVSLHLGLVVDAADLLAAWEARLGQRVEGLAG